MTRLSKLLTATAVASFLALPVTAGSSSESESANNGAAMDGPAAEQGATGPAPTVTETETADASELSDETLDAFAEAAIGVAMIQQDYAQQISQATDEAAAQKLASEAQAKMIEAVQQTDSMTVEEYVAIGKLAENDPAFAHRLTLLVQEKANMPQTDQPLPQTDG